MAVNVALSYPGIQAVKEMVYTQTGGTSPDKLSLKIVPQALSVASVADFTFSYAGVPLTLPDCLVDKSNIRYTQNGWVGSFVLLDRRWKWAKAPNMVVHWNDRNANGVIIAPSRRTVQQMLSEVLQWIGESSYDLSQVDASDYPEFNEVSTHPLDILNSIMDMYGYEIVLGFGAEPVRIVKTGTGNYLPSNGIRMLSTSYDPPTPVNTVRTHFGPSRMEARLKLEAVGIDTDGKMKRLDQLSYKPSEDDGGWKYEPPGDFGSVKKNAGDAAHALAVRSVYRFYRVAGFSDGEGEDPTGDIPDGSGSIEHPAQLLPLLQGLFPIVTSNGSVTRPDEQLYGKVLKKIVDPAGAAYGNTDASTLLETDFSLFRSEGLVVFPTDQPMYTVVNSEINPAELWLECTFQIHQNNNWQYGIYHKDIVVDSNGFGYLTVSMPELSNQVRTFYDSSQSVTSTTSNAAELDLVATQNAANAVAKYSVNSGESVWYAAPQLSVRLDGAITQITHVISDTQGHYSIISRNMSHDTHVLTAKQKRAEALELFNRSKRRRFEIARLRREANRD